MSDVASSRSPAARGTARVIDARTLSSFRVSLLLSTRRSDDGRIILDRGSFRLPDVVELERRLNELYDDCGCGTGAVAAAVVLAAMLAWAAWASPEVTWSLGVKAAGVLLAGAVLGKLVGIIRSRILLWRLLSRLESRL